MTTICGKSLMKQHEGNLLTRLPRALVVFAGLGVLLNAAWANAQGEGFHVSTLGVLQVNGRDTYYDGSNGTLFVKVPLPDGATALQFSVTGVVTTDGTNFPASPDGLDSDGRARYNWSDTRWSGTYSGVRVGNTTGVDPALYGVFFNPDFSGMPENSLNYRSDSGIQPDPRTLPSYTPSANQPFWIGDGYDSTNPYVTFDSDYLPAWGKPNLQYPGGATFLLLGLGADIDYADNLP